MSGTYTVTMDANGSVHTYAGLSAKLVSKLFHHFDNQALGKVLDMVPEADDTSGSGTNNVQFTCKTVNDLTGVNVGDQTNNWYNISDAAAGALQGAFDDALAKLDKHLASHHK